jgi:uncharacterized protein YydD (DUF2326 family)
MTTCVRSASVFLVEAGVFRCGVCPVHDGGLEALDDRKKIEFIEYLRTVSSINGFQYVLTVIDSDLPSGFKFSD